MKKYALPGVLAGGFIVWLCAQPPELAAAEPSAPEMPGTWSEPLEHREPHNHPSYGDVILGHADDLRLSDEQLGKIIRLHHAHQKKVRELIVRLRSARHSAYTLFMDPASSEAAIRQAAQAHTAAFDELVETALKTRREVNSVLTPEQLSKMATLRSTP